LPTRHIQVAQNLWCCFNAVGLAYVDVAIADDRVSACGMGQDLQVQHEMIFEHARLKDWVRI